jgi:NADH-quinone oxidoreductase subunit G
MCAATLQQLGLTSGQQVRITSSHGAVQLVCELDDGLPAGTVRLSAGFDMTAALGSASAQLQVERA